LRSPRAASRPASTAWPVRSPAGMRASTRETGQWSTRCLAYVLRVVAEADDPCNLRRSWDTANAGAIRKAATRTPFAEEPRNAAIACLEATMTTRTALRDLRAEDLMQRDLVTVNVG